MANKIRSRDRTPYDLVDGVKVRGNLLSSETGAKEIGTYSGLTAVDAALTLANVAELRNLPVPTVVAGKIVAIHLLGYYTPGDGGGGRVFWDAANVSADDGGIVFKPVSNPTTGRWKRAYEGSVNARWFGAKGDGITDDTSAIQNAINYCYNIGGGKVSLPNGSYLANLILKNGVILSGKNTEMPGITWGSFHPVQIKGFTTGTVIDTPDEVISCSITGISIVGKNYSAPYGIKFRNVNGGSIIFCNVAGTLDAGIYVNGVACYLNQILITDSLITRTRSSFGGALTINGADHLIYNVEAQVGNQHFGDQISNTNKYLAGICIRGANHFLTNCIGELSDIGFYIEGMLISLVGCRGDLNNADGFIINGQVQLTGCRAVNNSKNNDGVYSGFLVTGQGAQLTGCTSIQNNGTYKTKYSYADSTSWIDQSSRNLFIGCHGYGHLTSKYLINGNSGKTGRVETIGGNSNVTLTSGNITLDVTDVSSVFLTQGTAPTEIQYLTGGVPGQSVIFITDVITQQISFGNTWYSNTGGIRTNSEPSSKILANKRAYRLTFNGNFWSEV